MSSKLVLRQIKSQLIMRKYVSHYYNQTWKKSKMNDIQDSNAVPLAYTSYTPGNMLTEDKKPTLFVIHGFLGSKNNWNSVAKAVVARTNRTVITVDMRNHGESTHTDEFSYESMVADLHQLIKNLGLKGDNSICLLGHSMGGRVAMSYARKYRQTVSGLVVVDVSPITDHDSMDDFTYILEAMRRVRLEPNLSLSEARHEANNQLRSFGVSGNFLRSFLLTNLIKEEGKGFAWRLNINSLLKHQKTLSRFSNSGVPPFRKPTVFIRGGDSDYVPESHYNAISKMYPNSKVIKIDDCNHLPHFEKPQEFIEHVCKFLASKNV